MSRFGSTDQWCRLIAGLFMLGAAVLVVLICLGNKIGFLQAGACIVLGGLLVLWIIVGIVLVVSGLHK